MNARKLPPNTVLAGGAIARCPWCACDVGGATVTIDALFDAFHDKALDWAERGPLGTPERGLVSACPTCARPFMVALRYAREGGHDRPVAVLLPVRTDADVKFICGEGAW